MMIREKVEQGIMTVAWESGDWNISDLGTKPTDTPTTTRLVTILYVGKKKYQYQQDKR